MFRREREDRRFAVAGLWGSGNVVTPRDELLAATEAYDWTAYTMWDGHALFGPGVPGALEKAAVLTAVLPIEEHLARYGLLAERCEVWSGEEELGVGCEAACTHLAEVCPTEPYDVCLTECARYPRELVDCVAASQVCARDSGCEFDAWNAATSRR